MNVERFTGRRVLVADSDPVFCEIMKHILTNRRFIVEAKNDGFSAFASIESERLDLVILDLKLPGLSGFEFIAKCREIKPDLPIIIVTAKGDIEDAISAIRHDVFFFFVKPIINYEEFFRVIDTALERQELIAQNVIYQEELNRLNNYLQQSVKDKTAEISLMKDRLSELFLKVPQILNGKTILEKLSFTAEALSGPHFFSHCNLYYEDRDNHIILTARGEYCDYAQSQNYTEQYWNIKGLFNEANHEVIIDRAKINSNEHLFQLLFPIKAQSNQIIGVVELITENKISESHKETFTIIELFLSQVSQSIEQFNLERELEKSESLYRSLIDNVSDVIFRLNREGKFTFVSRKVQELLNLNWKQVLGLKFISFVDDNDKPWVEENFQEILAGKSKSFDLTLMRADESEVVAFIAANPLEANGVITDILGVARDVTEKRRLELQVTESERRYRALMENAYDAIVLIDPETYGLIDINPQVEYLTGYSREELLKMSILNLHRVNDSEKVKSHIEGVISTGTGRFEDAPLVRKDGIEIEIDTAASMLKIEGKLFYQAIMRDISLQKSVNLSLSQQDMDLKILSEVSDALQSIVEPKSVMKIVMAGVTAGKGFGFNRAFIFSYNKTRHELELEASIGPKTAEEAGRIWSELEVKEMSLTEILDAQANSVNNADDSTIIESKIFIRVNQDNLLDRVINSHEAFISNSDISTQEFFKEYRIEEFAIVPFVTRDETIGVLLVDNLFTKQPIQEDDLHRLKLYANSAASAIERSRLLASLEKRLQELTSANIEIKESRDRLVKTERLSAVGEVAASVAHEIRNPLTSIGGFARNVLSSLPENDKNRRKIQIIVEETKRLESILSSILEFSKPTVPKFSELDINSLILQTIHFMDAEIDDNLIKFELKLKENLQLARADADQIRQVLLNLIRNAVQVMPSGGFIKVSTDQNENGISFEISDSGPGIAPEIMDKIFNAFYTTKSTGSGLGLSICSQIIRNHGGKIEAHSNIDQGATFKVSLPTMS